MLGKTGKNFPINASQYTRLALRMYLSPGSAGKSGQLFWSKDTVYNGSSVANVFTSTTTGSSISSTSPPWGSPQGTDTWSGLVDSLRFDPIYKRDKTIQIDWIRLVSYDAATARTTSWSGWTAGADIYLDNDKNAANGNLGMLAKGVGGSSYSFLAGALAPGDYYIAVAPAGDLELRLLPRATITSTTCRSFNFTSPSDEGSDQDFITVNTGNPWDMNGATDIDYTVNTVNPQFTTLSYEDTAGRAYSQPVRLPRPSAFPGPATRSPSSSISFTGERLSASIPTATITWS